MIELKDVSFSYSGREGSGLHDVNLTVGDGECVLLCGRSGCGKTTVSRLVNGLIPRYYPGELSGSVRIDGREVSDLAMYELSQRVGSVFQNPRTQFFNTDCDSEMAFGLENEGRPFEELRQRVEAVTDELRLERLRGRSLHALSGGEKQQIAFASVHAMEPEVYILDEPSSNLDMGAIENLRTYLAFVKNQGKTIIVAEHRIHYLMDLVDRIVYLEQGRIAGAYSPDEFKRLAADEQERMGLRAADLGRVHPVATQGPRPAPVLKLEDVGLYYRKRPVVEGIGLSAGRGEVVGIVGHNGSGKTTLSRALCGLHKRTDGKFSWDGAPQDRKARMKRSYLVMQDVNYQLFADSVRAECTFGIKGADERAADSSMERLGLGPYREFHPNTLSGGQKQRLAVAVSMVCGKEVLVFDEPTSGLDFDSMAQVASLVKDLAAMGKVVFIVTHDYEFVCRTCSRVFHIDKDEACIDLAVSKEAEAPLRNLFGLRACDAEGVEGA